DWVLGAPQEAMATQANHHWAHAEARLTGAIDRWLRGEKLGIDPMKANLTEVLTFLDWISCGMNRIVMHDTEGTSSPYNRALYLNTHAWLERDDLGRIIRVSVDGRDYRFEVDTQGVTTAILKAPGIPVDDEVDALRDTSQLIRPLLNDAAGGGVISIASFTQASHGTVIDEGNGVLRYEPDAGYSGLDEFTYLLDGAVRAGRVRIYVREPAESVPGVTMETWTGLGGSSLVDLTSSPQFPHEPDAIELRADFAAPTNRGGNFGTRITALVVPPESGDYTFWIASDDQSELWLGEDRSSSSRMRIAWVDVWTDVNEWNKYPSQQSVAIPLIGGRPYYLEARHKEGGGGDNLSVSWQGPGMNRETITQAFLRTVDRHAPLLVKAPADVEMVENASTSVVDLNGVFEDADFMDSLGLEVIANTNPDLIRYSLQGELLLISASTGRTGQATLTLRVEVRGGAVATDDFVVTVLADLDGDGISDIADLDDDGDGMPDSWEITHGLNPRIPNANADDDGDGWSNLQEFVSETNPRNPMDRQHFWIEDASESIVSLGFTTSSARRYTVQFRDQLDADSWSNLHEPRAGTGTNDFVNDSRSPFHARFYRLRVELP
ncbi:MAG: Ig-like domain-containing protein, partial [Luteolibacter sp.]